MAEYVSLKIDGATVKARQGQSVLDVANEYGICIPHLCHYPTLSDFGGCRVCIVENIVHGRSRVTASCTLEAAGGLVVLTNTPRIRRLRRNIAELLVAQAPNSRAIQDLALRCGVRQVRYSFHNESCVLCGRCVRVCQEMWQARALGFVGRGKRRHVASPFNNRAELCKECRTCIDICPMTITPCYGPMKSGQESLCGRCEGQLLMADAAGGACVWCELGKGFGCTRQLQARGSRDGSRNALVMR
jgi:NADH dehydrogenase/NADH:ubiquinone oxidoreductase subunit G